MISVKLISDSNVTTSINTKEGVFIVFTGTREKCNLIYLLKIRFEIWINFSISKDEGNYLF